MTCGAAAVATVAAGVMLLQYKAVLFDCAANGNSMPPPPSRIKADDADIFGDAGTDYVCELPKVGTLLLCSIVSQVLHSLLAAANE